RDRGSRIPFIRLERGGLRGFTVQGEVPDDDSGFLPGNLAVLADLHENLPPTADIQSALVGDLLPRGDFNAAGAGFSHVEHHSRAAILLQALAVAGPGDRDLGSPGDLHGSFRIHPRIRADVHGPPGEHDTPARRADLAGYGEAV